jgi:hypothetical protein
VYLVDSPTGPTTAKLNDTIAYNFILANYHSSMAIDNDDGSAYYDTHHNVLWSASSAAAYGGNSLKSDFGGHDNFHHDNLDLFWSSGFGICPALANHNDGYYGNHLYLAKDGNYGNPAGCATFGQVCFPRTTMRPPRCACDTKPLNPTPHRAPTTQTQQGPNATTVFGNTVWSPTGAVTECGMSLAAYQAKGGDVGTTAGAYPDDSVVLAIAKSLMGLPA